MKETLLEIKDLCVKAEEKEILKGINLKIYLRAWFLFSAWR